jgi:5'-3' exonuclease
VSFELVLQSPGLEADDIIATLAVRALAEGCDVTIASPDKVLSHSLEPDPDGWAS